ncbi:2-hydroxyacyl-CoA dehydratase [Dysosmobacter sp. NSJ-60]|uniref:2-hydroxyglutaryl-CoA dehydratase n=1 Tax=Pusillibacter faecalis TaxID=2714358 RepID=A0A810Q5X1_9FIRM|nr:2-hydroxyacyl-CoA dehydratase [Dysosmobacter hominis]BCK83699.1 2-hydroxyglutaryl-CoA dehydratase [Pusillibacter faecalis]
MKVGLDVGSTTIKCVVLDDTDHIIYSTYERHLSHILEKSEELLRRVAAQYTPQAQLAISGSAGMGMAESVQIPFVQEVYATRVAAGRLAPGTDCIIELGGEDAKILFLTNGVEVRMNGSCAGGTGAFIDQMATLLKMGADEMDIAAQKAEKTYTIASRCGVFAKSDIQPLINQGAKAPDIAASIYQAVVNQTIAGLAQGRPICGQVLYLGGPLTFSRCLRESFDHTLGVRGICPENSLLFVALGAAYYADQEFDLTAVADRLRLHGASETYRSHPPLFANREEYEAFHARHAKAAVPRVPFGADYSAPVHIGIDSGSTTVKLAVIDQEARLLFTDYRPNLGNPVPLIREVLQKLYEEHPALHVASVTTTGYGEDLTQNAFHTDYGVVETVAHFTAARHFLPNVDFIIDIGGQDMKCFKIDHGAISDIFLNEACSSGCGSFLQTFAQALGRDIKDFAQLGLFAKRPVDLGSRCTVFMNSSVKQAQKDGATIENISAGLSISVVKNAIYKVIRAASPEELGRNIVVQGGTFYNEAVLRAFEKEMGVEVVRPDIAGLMGAYGAALYGKGRARADQVSTVLDREALAGFRQETESRQCGLCGNNCQLTVNTFADGATFISGNRCDRPITGKADDGAWNLYAYKRKLILGYKPVPGRRGKIGLPLCLNFWELLPFWHTFFTKLGFTVYHSPFSSRNLYVQGQGTIPSDTVCFPAKLAHGHIQFLSKLGVDAIFYPCMTYNVDEGLGDNHYNCPVVAYYPEVIAGNCPEVQEGGTKFIYDYVGIHRPKDFSRKIFEILRKTFPDLTKQEVREAADAAYAEYANHMALLRKEGGRMMERARAEGRRIIVLAGRPYHVDPEINHGIDTLITQFGAAVVTEDSVSDQVERFPTTVLNQWTYHSRLYAAAKYCCTHRDCDLVQLVSFGCGLDAITTDETREILHAGGKLYTQLKIDEITNLGAVRIRLRSLFAALDEQKEA